jgi:hypothetical protein
MTRPRRQTKRKALPIPPIEDLYGAGENGNLMHGQYGEREDIKAAIQRRHEKGMALINGDGYWEQNGRRWRVPLGIREAFAATLSHGHMMSRYPFYVQWKHPDGNGGFKIKRRSCTSLGTAVSFITVHAQRVDKDAFVVCKLGFYAPIKLLGKFPRRMADGKMYYWCPRCMQPRRHHQTNPPQTFYADKKYWSDEKNRYVWKNVKLAVLECSHCGASNRDNKFRASNQPVEKTRIKPRRTRVRRRR